MPIVNRDIERDIVQRGMQRGMSQEEIKQAVQAYRTSVTTTAQAQETSQKPGGFLSSVKESAQQRLTGIKEAFGRVVEKPGQERQQTPVETSLQVVGEGAGFLGDVIGAAVMTGAKAITPDSVEAAVAQKARQVLSTPMGQSAVEAVSKGVNDYNTWKTENPRAAENFEAVVNIASLLPVERAVTLGVKPAAQAAKQVAGEAGEVVVRTGQAAKQVAGDIIPDTQEIVSKQVTQALDLTQGDAKNILNATGREVGEFMAQNNLIRGNKKQTLEAVDDFFGQNYKRVRDNISQVQKTYSQGDVSRYSDALNAVKREIVDIPGREAANAEVDMLLKKEVLELGDVQRAKEILDEHFKLYRVTGDPAAGARKEGLRVIRSDLRKFIEDEVADATGADIRQLNNNVQAARGIHDATLSRATRGFTRNYVSLGDLSALGAGLMVGGPAIGVAALALKKMAQSPALKLRFAKWLDSLSDARRAQAIREMQKGDLPEGLPPSIADELDITGKDVVDDGPRGLDGLMR